MSRSVVKRQHAVNPRPRRGGRSEAGEAFSALVVQILRLNGVLSAAGEELAVPAGQTTARWRVLAAIEDQALTVAEIARRWRLARQSVQRVADELVAEGFCIYEDNPGHRRARLLRPTATGVAALRRIQRAQRAWADRLGTAIGVRDLSAANDALARVFAIVAADEGR